MPPILSVGTEKKIKKTSVIIADVATETRTQYLPNTSLECRLRTSWQQKQLFGRGENTTGYKVSFNVGEGGSKLRLFEHVLTQILTPGGRELLLRSFALGGRRDCEKCRY